MKGNGNNWSTLIQKLYFMLIPSSGKRTKYIIKHSYMFKHVGGGFFGSRGQFLQIQNLFQ